MSRMTSGRHCSVEEAQPVAQLALDDAESQARRGMVRSGAAPDKPERNPKQSDGREDKDCGLYSLEGREPIGGLIGLQNSDSMLVPAGLQVEVPPGIALTMGCQARIGDLVELARADAVAM